MKLKLLAVFAALPFLIFAQKSHRVTGYILDKNTAEALPFATVALLDAGKKFVSGTTTNETGGFQITLTKADTFYINAQYVGFQPLDTLLAAPGDQSSSNLMLLLVPKTGQLAEVTVSAEKTTGSVQMDKQTFSVAKLRNTTSGTGLDVLQRLPSVRINAEGKILMCGNAEFLVTVNGKFTNQTAADVLAQLPANTIENIEIISAPSASLDAEGKACIINIVTKQNLAAGWGILANANANGAARLNSTSSIFSLLSSSLEIEK